MEISIITNESYDWKILKTNDETIYEGHSILNYVFGEVLAAVAPGIKFIEKEISDEEMEKLC